MVFELIDETICLDLTGSFNAKVDDQGRLLLPAAFRNAMGGGDKKLKTCFFAMAHPSERKLVCFSTKEFEARLVPKSAEERGVIIANVYKVECQDNKGRFAVNRLANVSDWPKNRREFAFVGAGDRFYICPQEDRKSGESAIISDFLEGPET